jgi:hypothetical protein
VSPAHIYYLVIEDFIEMAHALLLVHPCISVRAFVLLEQLALVVELLLLLLHMHSAR